MSSTSFVIRAAVQADVPAIFHLINELAEFEKAPHEVINTPDRLLHDGFTINPPLYVAKVAENAEGVIMGFSLCYLRYSTWKGAVLYLEDLYVRETFRGNGVGKALFESCIEYAKVNGYKRLTWQVLDWNQPAIDFYKRWNAVMDPEWINGSLNF
jgi:GNAT superfamily N-acetyltransferase